MTNPMVTIHNVETNEIETREMTAEELQQWTTEKAANDAIKAAQADKEAAKAELLAKLGITAEEAALLLA